MSRPLAYISAAWNSNKRLADKQALEYCRKVFNAGYSPICPRLLHEGFLDKGVMKERNEAVGMAAELLRRSRILVVCSKTTDEQVMNDIGIAKRNHVAATTLEGILKVEGKTKKPEE